jgi:hypothetical protein
VTVCHRPANPNRAAAKTKHEWYVEDGTIHGGLIKRVSPGMIHTYFDYMTSEYPRHRGHGMLLVQLYGERSGQPWTMDAARRRLRRAGERSGLGWAGPGGGGGGGPGRPPRCDRLRQL